MGYRTKIRDSNAKIEKQKGLNPNQYKTNIFLPVFRGIGKCQNWKVSELECQNWKVLELESVRIGKCQNRSPFYPLKRE